MQKPDKASFTCQYFDYSEGRSNPPLLTVMVGAAGSGKSTAAKYMVSYDRSGKTVRFNRDDLRAMLFVDSQYNHKNEDLVRKYEEEGVRVALGMGRDVVVDDTNCVARTRNVFEKIAMGTRSKFCLCVMNTSKEECLLRNAQRTGKERVPDDAIIKQFKSLCAETVQPQGYEVGPENRAVSDLQALQAGELRLRLPDADVVIFDVDGTLADCTGVRDPHDESRVILDRVRGPVASWARALYPTKNVIIMSGRHSGCCSDTCDWLESMARVPFDFIFMRPDGSNVSDVIVKQNILDTILTRIPKTQIAFAVDDRLRVVNQVWRANGIKVYPVGGTGDHSVTCQFKPEKKGWRHCPECGIGKGSRRPGNGLFVHQMPQMRRHQKPEEKEEMTTKPTKLFCDSRPAYLCGNPIYRDGNLIYFEHFFSNRRGVQACRDYARQNDPMWEVEVSEGLDTPDSYWGWWDAKDEAFMYIFHSRLQVDMCFPYGAKAEEDRLRGKLLPVSIKLLRKVEAS